VCVDLPAFFRGRNPINARRHERVEILTNRHNSL
jgi:hypothetical protein